MKDNNIDKLEVINKFIYDSGLCEPFYYYTSIYSYTKNYNKILEWLNNPLVDDIIVDKECWQFFRVFDTAVIASASFQVSKSIYAIGKSKEMGINKIRKIKLHGLAHGNF